MLEYPSFVDTTLEQGSSKDLKNGFLKDGVPKRFKFNRSALHLDEHFPVKIYRILKNADQSVWLESGYEILGSRLIVFNNLMKSLWRPLKQTN